MKRLLILFLGVSFMTAGTAHALPFSKKKDEKKPAPATAAKTDSGKAAAPAKAEAAKGENVEQLFKTLNETLEENRKIRANLKDLQEALQKKTLEGEDLRDQLKKLEGLALERNENLTSQSAQLEKQLKESSDTMKKVEEEKKAFEKEKDKIQQEVTGTREENEKLKKVLASSVLGEEKDVILKAAQESGEAAQKAQRRLAELNAENQAMRNDLASLYYETGNVLFQLRRYEEAVTAYGKALEFDPSNAWVYHNMAVIEDYYLNHKTKAFVYYQQYLSFKPIEEQAQKVRQRVLDLNLLQKVMPETPLKGDFEAVHRDQKG